MSEVRPGTDQNLNHIWLALLHKIKWHEHMSFDWAFLNIVILYPVRVCSRSLQSSTFSSCVGGGLLSPHLDHVSNFLSQHLLCPHPTEPEADLTIYRYCCELSMCAQWWVGGWRSWSQEVKAPRFLCTKTSTKCLHEF